MHLMLVEPVHLRYALSLVNEVDLTLHMTDLVGKGKERAECLGQIIGTMPARLAEAKVSLRLTRDCADNKAANFDELDFDFQRLFS